MLDFQQKLQKMCHKKTAPYHLVTIIAMCPIILYHTYPAAPAFSLTEAGKICDSCVPLLAVKSLGIFLVDLQKNIIYIYMQNCYNFTKQLPKQYEA